MALTEEILNNLNQAKKGIDEEMRIALIGQPGAGKSSLINRIMGKKIFETGVHTDTTVEADEAKLDKLYIVDLPGYGTSRFPFDEWVEKFQPQNYDLYIFVFAGKLHDSDTRMFQSLKIWADKHAGHRQPLFIVRNFVDSLWDEEKTLDELKAEVVADVCGKMGETVPVYFTSCARNPEGIDELKEAIKNADIPGAKKSKFLRNFRATTLKDLEDKRRDALVNVKNYAIAGALNGLNPVPGLDISVDVGVMWKMLSDVRESFGIDSETESKLQKYKIIVPAARNVFALMAKESVKNFLEKEAVNFLGKNFSKYVPFVGQATAACVGYAMTVELGKRYVEDCYQLALRIMEKILENER
ncbi:MAG: 50S ribosome-binding GTPase [Schwartzia sp.]|nr:50S ribosome-binding GTPase [Schwartzia sp. (in: firmicutes)]